MPKTATVDSEKKVLPQSDKGIGYLAGVESGKTVLHQDGDKGGLIVGHRHRDGGVKAVNTSTGKPLEVETGEVSIASSAVNSDNVYEFDGEQMTAKEVLSKINSDAGGVKFKNGGNVPKAKHMFNGKEMTDEEIQQQLLEAGHGAVIDKRTGEDVVYHGGETIITRPAVLSTEKKLFNGEMRTNLEILSIINQDGGGIALTDTDEYVHTTGKEYLYGGEILKDFQIVEQCGCKHKMCDNANLTPYALQLYTAGKERYDSASESQKKDYLERLNSNRDKYYAKLQAKNADTPPELIQSWTDFVLAADKLMQEINSVQNKNVAEAEKKTVIRQDVILAKNRVANLKKSIEHMKGHDMLQEMLPNAELQLAEAEEKLQQVLEAWALQYHESYDDEYEEGGVIETLFPAFNEDMAEAEVMSAIKTVIDENRAQSNQVVNNRWSNLRKLTYINDKIQEYTNVDNINPYLAQMYSSLLYIWECARKSVVVATYRVKLK